MDVAERNMLLDALRSPPAGPTTSPLPEAISTESSSFSENLHFALNNHFSLSNQTQQSNKSSVTTQNTKSSNSTQNRQASSSQSDNSSSSVNASHQQPKAGESRRTGSQHSAPPVKTPAPSAQDNPPTEQLTVPVDSTAWDEGLETVVLTSLEFGLASASPEVSDENAAEPVTEAVEPQVSQGEFEDETSPVSSTPHEEQPAVLLAENTPPPLLIAMAESMALSRNAEAQGRSVAQAQESPAVEPGSGPAGLLNALSQPLALPEEYGHPHDQTPSPNLLTHLPREHHFAQNPPEPELTTTSRQSAITVPEAANPQPVANPDSGDSSAERRHRTAQPTQTSLLEIPAALVGLPSPEQPPTPSIPVAAWPGSGGEDRSPLTVPTVLASTPTEDAALTTSPGTSLETNSSSMLTTPVRAPLAEDATPTLLSKVWAGAKSAESPPDPTQPPLEVTTQPDRPATLLTPGPSNEELSATEETRSRDDAVRLPTTPPMKHPPADRSTLSATPTVVPTHDAQQLVDRLTEVLLVARDHGQQLALQLSPPELGPLRVEVHVHQGAVFARLETLTEAARQVLTEHLPKLQEALSHRGTPLERIEVVRRDDSETTSGFSQPQWSAAEQQPGREEHASPRRRWSEPLTARRRTAEVSPSPVLDAGLGLQELNIRI